MTSPSFQSHPPAPLGAKGPLLSLWRGLIQPPRQVASLSLAREIATAVAAEHGLTFDELTTPSRARELVSIRWRAMAAIHATGRYSLPSIAAALGLKDHTTVINGLRRHAERVRGQA